MWACRHRLLGWEGPRYLGKHVSLYVWPPWFELFLLVRGQALSTLLATPQGEKVVQSCWSLALCIPLPSSDHWPAHLLVMSEATEKGVSLIIWTSDQSNHTEWQDEVHLGTREFLVAGSLEIKAGYPSEAVLPVCSLFAEPGPNSNPDLSHLPTRRRNICKEVRPLGEFGTCKMNTVVWVESHLSQSTLV